MWRVIKGNTNVDLRFLCAATHTEFLFLSSISVCWELIDRVLRSQQDPGCLT